MMPEEETASPLPRTVSVLRSDMDLVKAALAGVQNEFGPTGRVGILEASEARHERILLGEYDKETNTVRPGVVQTNEALLKGQAKLVLWGLPMLAVVAVCTVILVCVVIFQPGGAGAFGAFLHGFQKGG